MANPRRRKSKPEAEHEAAPTQKMTAKERLQVKSAAFKKKHAKKIAKWKERSAAMNERYKERKAERKAKRNATRLAVPKKRTAPKKSKATSSATPAKSKFGSGSSLTVQHKGRSMANVTKEQLKASGLSLREYMNQWKKTGKRP